MKIGLCQPRLPAPAHLLSVRCDFTISHGRITGASRTRANICARFARSPSNKPPLTLKSQRRFEQRCRVRRAVQLACTLCARARTRSPRTRARTPSARTPLSPAPPALHPPAPHAPHPTHPRAGFHASSDALLSARRSRHSIMCIRGFAPPPPAQAFLFPPLPRLCLWPCRLGAGPSRR